MASKKTSQARSLKLTSIMGCATNGDFDSSGYNTPVPWVGLYITSASFLCSLAMAADLLAGLRRGKRWFPSRFFSLNATTLTLIAIATKLPVDLTSPMPSTIDQLSKLSGTAFLSITIPNFLPSLGDTPDTAPNVIALAILVLTVVANVSIQIATGVIFTFLIEHILLLILLLILLTLLSSSALTVSATKNLLETQFDSKHSQASDSSSNLTAEASLREFVKKYWLMAHTCSPQFVLGRSVTCTASGAFCLLSAGILIEAIVKSMVKENWEICSGESDYKWSTTAVLFSQAVAVVVGTIAPAYRWFSAVNFRSPQAGGWSCRDEFKVEGYWIQRLVDWRLAPFPLEIGNRRIRKIAHQSKRLVLDASIILQSGVVVVCKLVRLASVLPVNWLNRSRRLVTRNDSSTRSTLTAGYQPGSRSDLSDFVIHLEGETELVRLIMRSGQKDTEKWIQRGSKNQPLHLFNLIKNHSTARYGFRGANEFDSDGVPSLVQEEPPNCWALPLVTLTSIAVALSEASVSIESLLCAVSEGLKYVRLVEKHLDAKGLVNMREAADIVWLDVDIYDRWFDEDLRGLVGREKSGRKAIERLGDEAKGYVVEFLDKMKDGDELTNPLRWPEKVLAANCMYRVSKTILQECTENPRTDRDLFFRVQTMISDILGACLTNLPRAIYMECCSSAIEVREKSVREAAFLLGEGEEILKILREDEIVCFYPERRDYIDDWRERLQNHPTVPTSTSNLIGSTLDEFCP